MPSSSEVLGHKYINLSDLESGQAPFQMPLIKQTHRLARLHRVHDKYSHSSTYTYKEFLQDIIIENLPIYEEEVIHSTRRAMSISGSILAKHRDH